jgi:quercetin dioxygenase-like cupin family protein
MPVVESDVAMTVVRPGVTRRLIHGENLMMVVIDFVNGPWQEPDPPHSHVHEQSTYVAEGEIVLFCEGEPERYLRQGDMFFIPSRRQHTIRLLSERARLVDSFNPIRQEFLP